MMIYSICDKHKILVFTVIILFFYPLTFLAQNNVETFTSSGTFVVPVGVDSVIVECWGAGGGGGGSTSNTNGGSGGGGGSYCINKLQVTPNQSINYTVGTGGAGGSSSNNWNGVGGGSTTFLTLSAGGGGGGTSNRGLIGSGGTATGGLSTGGNVSGGDGAPGGTSGGSGGAGANGGSGGAGSQNSSGNSGTSPGGGGGGGEASTVFLIFPVSQPGGNGANGLIKVSYKVKNVIVTSTQGVSYSSHATLKQAVDKINDGTHRGRISIIINNSTNETTSIVLNASGQSSTYYTDITLYPTGPDISVTGNINAPLFNLNGASNVRINGSVYLSNTTPGLSFINNSTGLNASAISFTNSSRNNNISFCNLKSNTQGVTNGVVLFGGSTSGSGNDNDTIQYCNLSGTGNTSATRPINTIYSSGSTGFINNDNIVRNNNFLDFMNPGNTSYAVNIYNNSAGYILTDNSFFETASFSPSTGAAYTFININSDGGGYNISRNFIGGNSNSSAGTLYKTGNTNAFTGIYINAAESPATSIQGNTIRGINWANDGASDWIGINIVNGNVNAGDVTGNVIGDAAGNASIYVRSGASGSNFYGIRVSSTKNVTINNSVIGSVDFGCSNSQFSANLFGIYKTNVPGDLNLNYNTIGSNTTDNSFHASSLATANIQTVIGVYSAGTSNTVINGNTISNVTNATSSNLASLTRGIMTQYGSNTISNNTVRYISTLNYNSSNYENATLIGIMQISTLAGTTQAVTGNIVHNLKNHTTSKIEVYGIFYRGPSTGSHEIARNFIHTFDIVSNLEAYLHGLSLYSGTYTATNNIVFLGNNITTGCRIWGIWNFSNDPIVIAFNTSYLSGQANDGNSNSYAFRDISTAPTNRTIVNNILWNGRTNTTAIAHYAIYLAQTANTTVNYNDYQFAQSFGQIGTSTYSTLQAWVNNTSNNFDNNSFIVDPMLTNLGGLSPSDYQAGVALPGTPVPGITTDFGYNERNESQPTIGAWEFVSKPVEVWNGTSFRQSYQNLRLAFNSINTGTWTGDITIKIKGNTNENSKAVLYQSGYSASNYSSVLIYPTRSDVQINGNLSTALVELNGADNVVIDGRTGGSGAANNLMFVNESIEGSTISFINSAQNNIVRFCKVRGLKNSATGGIVEFLTSSSGSGNDNNSLLNNDISVFNNSIGSRVSNAIYSQGSTNANNSSNIISNNNIYDTWSKSASSTHINLSDNSSAFTVSHNNFFETTTFTPSTDNQYNFVKINNDGEGFSVISNNMGGSAVLCQGSPLAIGTTTTSTVFIPILINVSTATPSSIQGNTITNISLTSENSSPFIAMSINGGSVNIGNISGNTIGSTTGNNAINVLTATTLTAYSFGISLSGEGNTIVAQNTLSNIFTNTSSSSNGHGFVGLYKNASGGSFTVYNNTIGSITQSNSINCYSQSSNQSQLVLGLLTEGTGHIQIYDNTICNLTNSTTRNDVENSIYGIYFQNSSNTGNLISRNFIANLNNNNNTRNSKVILSGIRLASGYMDVINNIVLLGSGNLNNAGLYGIYLNGQSGQNNIYFNTIYINGASPSNTQTFTSAFYRAASTNTTNVRNNIFCNARTGNANYHLTISLNGNAGLTKNHNNYILGTSGFLGRYNNNSYSSWTDWTNTTGNESGSLRINPLFSSPGQISPYAYQAEANLSGISISGISTDFGLNTRNSSNPTIGAWERVNKWKGSISIDWQEAGNWTGNVVPGVDENIIFDESPSRPCYLDQNRSVGSIINNQSPYRLIVNGKKLTIKGNLIFNNGAQIDASSALSTVEFAGLSTQVIPNAAFYNNKVFNISVSNSNNVILKGTISFMNTLEVNTGFLDATSSLATIEYSGSTNQSIESSQYLNNRINNLVIDNQTGVNLNTDLTVANDLTINSGDKLIISPTSTLTVYGNTTNNSDYSGLQLISNNLGTASLIHNSFGVSATVQRYIGGTAADWHFLSTPLSGQPIHGTIWTPPGGYGDGTGYDMYIWDEPSSCWIYNLNTTVSPTWPSIHSSTSFMPGRGYLYATLESSPTKQFTGELNNGYITRSLTVTSTAVDTLQGFNFIGNPYPSSIDWANSSGFSRNMLTQNPGGGNDIWVWSQSANNYGVYNSADADGVGTNNITRYISPMQGFFVHAASNGDFVFNNTSRVHNQAGNWLRDAYNTNTSSIKIGVYSESDSGSDEVLLRTGHNSTTGGAPKLFSHVKSAPSLYLTHNGKKYSTLNTLNETANHKILLSFSAGEDGVYILRCKTDDITSNKYILEDRKNGKTHDFSLSESYSFIASTRDIKERFVLHFNELSPVDQPHKSDVYVHSGVLNIDLTTIVDDYYITIYDINGRLIHRDNGYAGKLHAFKLPSRGIYITILNSGKTRLTFKTAY